MTPTEIIRTDIEEHGLSADAVLAKVASDVKSGVSAILRSGNTVLVLHHISKDVADVHLFTCDKAHALAKAMVKIAHKIVKSHVKRIYGDADNPEIVRFVNKFCFPVQASDRNGFNWMADTEGK